MSSEIEVTPIRISNNKVVYYQTKTENNKVSIIGKVKMNKEMEFKQKTDDIKIPKKMEQTFKKAGIPDNEIMTFIDNILKQNKKERKEK